MLILEFKHPKDYLFDQTFAFTELDEPFQATVYDLEIGEARRI